MVSRASLLLSDQLLSFRVDELISNLEGLTSHVDGFEGIVLCNLRRYWVMLIRGLYNSLDCCHSQ